MSAIDLSGKILLVHSHYGTAPNLFTHAEKQGVGVILREVDLTSAHIDAAAGIITTTHLDQIGFLAFKPQLEALLDRGGRWFFNGHVMRPLLEGLQTFVPMHRAKQHELFLTQLGPHPIFEGLDITSFEKNKGVAGFYGRGYNPMPEGARAITGVGPNHLPLDWEWPRPKGGYFFSHAGNDLGSMGGVNPSHDIIAPRLLDWVLQGVNK